MSRKILLVLAALIIMVSAVVILTDETLLLDERNVVLVGYSKYSQKWIDIKEGALSAGQKQGVNVTAVACDSIHSVSDQIHLIENAIEDKADAIIIMPTDLDEMSGIIEKVMHNNIDLVIIDNYQSFEEFYIQRVGTDLDAIAIDMANSIAESAKGEINIGCIFSYSDNSKSFLIYSKFREQMKQYNNINVIEKSISAADENIAGAETGILLNTYDIDYLVCFEEIITKGAADYLSKREESQSIGKSQTQIVGIGEISECARYLEDEIIYALGVQSYYNMGYLSVLNYTENLQADKHSAHFIVHNEELYDEEYQKILFRIK